MNYNTGTWCCEPKCAPFRYHVPIKLDITKVGQMREMGTCVGLPRRWRETASFSGSSKSFERVVDGEGKDLAVSNTAGTITQVGRRVLFVRIRIFSCSHI